MTEKCVFLEMRWNIENSVMISIEQLQMNQISALNNP